MEHEDWFESLQEEMRFRGKADEVMAARLRAELDDAEERNLTYEPPFSGSRPQKTSEYEAIHPRWIRLLSADLPEGVAAEPSPSPHVAKGLWPDTFHGEQGCAQCGACQYYVPLEGGIGSDWGACTNPRSQYDRTCTFEHWTCREYTP